MAAADDASETSGVNFGGQVALIEVSDTEKDIQAERPIVVCLEMTRIKLERRRVVVDCTAEIR